MKNIFKLFSLLFVAMFSANSMAQQMPELPLDPAVRYGKLENGLTYYIRHNAEQKGLADFYIAQKVGAVQEEDTQRGLAHFLEHMCFNGSEHFPGSDDLIKYCESIGVKFGYNLNAYTACDETLYNISDVPVTPENVEGMFNILYDWAAGLTLPGEEIDKERGVIKEEWRMRNSGAMRIYERAFPLLMPGSRYAYRLPIGTMEVVENFEHKELRDYYHKWYRPDLQGIIIVGDVNVDELEAKVKDVFGKIKMPENAAPYEFYPVPNNNEPIYVIDKDKELNRASISLYFKHEPLPLEMRNTPVGVGMDLGTSMVCSMLNARLEEMAQKPTCNFIGASAYYSNMIVAKTINAFTVGIMPKPGKDAEAVQEVMQEVQRAVLHGFTGSEKFRAQENIISSLERLNQNRDKQKNETYVNQFVRHFLDNEPAMDIATTFQVYKQIADALPLEVYSQLVKELAASTDTNFVFFAMYPEKDDVVVPTVDAMKVAVKAALDADLAPYVDNVKNEPLVPELPAKGSIVKEEKADFGYTKWTLSNGANVFFRQTDFNDAQVLVDAESFGGMSLVKEADVLNARILPEVMNCTGLGNFTAVELQKKLAGKQVSTNVSLGEAMEYINGNATPKDLRTLFELLYLRFQKPADDPDAYKNYMDYQRLQYANAAMWPKMACNDSISSTLYPGVERQCAFTLEDFDKMNYEEIKRI
ncbi:MAG: insulinase family protein, partial [Bacteroidaceae bacterium]|nr:insulinase family protein [Bacteroidaceae bacterium]